MLIGTVGRCHRYSRRVDNRVNGISLYDCHGSAPCGGSPCCRSLSSYYDLSLPFLDRLHKHVGFGALLGDCAFLVSQCFVLAQGTQFVLGGLPSRLVCWTTPLSGFGGMSASWGGGGHLSLTERKNSALNKRLEQQLTALKLSWRLSRKRWQPAEASRASCFCFSHRGRLMRVSSTENLGRSRECCTAHHPKEFLPCRYKQTAPITSNKEGSIEHYSTPSKDYTHR